MKFRFLPQLLLTALLCYSSTAFAQSGSTGQPQTGAATTSYSPANLRLGYSIPFTYERGLAQFTWIPGSGSNWVMFIREVRSAAGSMQLPVNGHVFSAAPGTQDMRSANYLGSDTYAISAGRVSPADTVTYLRNAAIGHVYEARVFEYSGKTNAEVYLQPTLATLVFTAGRFSPQLTGNLGTGNRPSLSWYTQAQYKCLGFQLELSTNGQSYSATGAFIPGSDSLNTQVSSSQQPPVITGPTYYRVRMSHRDGVVLYSDPVLLAPPLPLPVELTSFTGKLTSSGNALLNWTTASETNSDFFAIERSIDGRTYQRVGTVLAAGSSSAARTYQLLDREPVTGLTYYRLYQADRDGKSTYANPISLKATAAPVAFALYPNPAIAGGFAPTLRCTNGEGQVLTVEVFDLAGRNVLSLHAPVSTASAEVPLSLPADSAAGVYLVQVHAASGLSWQSRLSLKR